MYKIDYNNKYFPKNLEELGTPYENNNNNNFKIESIESLTNYFNKLKKYIFYYNSVFHNITKNHHHVASL